MLKPETSHGGRWENVNYWVALNEHESGLGASASLRTAPPRTGPRVGDVRLAGRSTAAAAAGESRQS